MMMPGEVKVLAYLSKHGWATVADVTSACLPGTPKELVSRILGNLDWLGYVTACPGPGGATAALQITQKGMAASCGPAVAAPP
jgi:DNA-binding IscR family transcriptional regulator